MAASSCRLIDLLFENKEVGISLRCRTVCPTKIVETVEQTNKNGPPIRTPIIRGLASDSAILSAWQASRLGWNFDSAET